MNPDEFDREGFSFTFGYPEPDPYDASRADGDFGSSLMLGGTAEDPTSPHDSRHKDHVFDQEFFGSSVSASMPGAFKSPDGMEVDESPQFTLESEVFHDTTNNMGGGSDQDFGLLSVHNEFNDNDKEKDFLKRSPLADNLTPNSNFAGSVQYDDSSIYSGAVENEAFLNPVGFGQAAMHYSLANELSPLTTTTSLTPSLSSIHSTQPSFFSAHQYLPRNSIDLTNSHRNSIDVFPKTRNSIDSQNSGPAPSRGQISGRYTSFTDSISSYIPFMGDKRGAAMSGPPSPGSQAVKTPMFTSLQDNPRQPSRHLIRSIFKSHPNSNEPQVQNIDMDKLAPHDFAEEPTDFFMMSPTREESEGDVLDALPSKKIKKPKRSLFTRFKPPIKQENEDELVNDNSSKNSGGNNSFVNEDDNSESVLNSTVNSDSRTPSSANTVRTAYANAVDTAVSNNSQYEPDYAALFENVGKRKKIVKTTSFKSRPKVKTEPDDKLGDDGSANSLDPSFSGESGASGQSETLVDEAPLTLANASKRILGSKLMKRKASRKIDPDLKNVKTTVLSQGVEVEVDLKTLDLPEDTKIFPTNMINSKTRTRGRKENKEADLTDSSKIYLCNYCSRRFKRQEHLRRHFRSLHTFEKPYDCPICHKKFSRSDNLNQHLKVHKEEAENDKVKAED